jgi:predicted nucleotidyltransferase
VSRLEDATRRAAADLEDLAPARWALIGGLAVSARAEPRLTRDADFAVAVDDDAAAEQLVFHLQQRGYRAQATIEHIPSGRLGTVRLLAPPATAVGVLVDLLFASSGIEPEVVARANVLAVFPGPGVPVASVGDLIAMKVLAFDERRRPQDYDDIVALLHYAGDEDIEVARASVALVTARGFHRDKDLATDLERMLAQRD